MRPSRAILERLTVLFRSFNPLVAHARRDAEPAAQLPNIGPFTPGQSYELSSIRHPGPLFERHRAAPFRRSLCAPLGVHHVSGHLSTMSPVRTVLAGWLGVRPAAFPPTPNILPSTTAARTRAEPAGATPALRPKLDRLPRCLTTTATTPSNTTQVGVQERPKSSLRNRPRRSAIWRWRTRPALP